MTTKRQWQKVSDLEVILILTAVLEQRILLGEACELYGIRPLDFARHLKISGLVDAAVKRFPPAVSERLLTILRATVLTDLVMHPDEVADVILSGELSGLYEAGLPGATEVN